MPLGFERLNSKKSQPNPNIVFIKPLPGPSKEAAQGFLERIAAQCVPIMRQHSIYVMSLEEHEPNSEFVGRNFNAGEVVQLVLKSPRTGRWLPHSYVQMVMMHELAHCKQMNHSRAFWKVRNEYAADMYKLWREGYMGDGVWGRGTNLETGEWERNVAHLDEVAAHHLCGGTFRSRSSKRKRKPVISYQERKQRRIAKKFGTQGVALGADDATKSKLEKGKKMQAKPRVAMSARGRELRAAAALARFEQQKETKPLKAGEEEASEEASESRDESRSNSDSETDESFEASADMPSAVDVNGQHLLDSKGRSMVKVCGEEDADDVQVKKELDELQDLFGPWPGRKGDVESTWLDGSKAKSKAGFSKEAWEQQWPSGQSTSPSLDPVGRGSVRRDSGRRDSGRRDSGRRDSGRVDSAGFGTETGNDEQRMTCSACSFVNSEPGLTCTVCANVLAPDKMAGAWQCHSAACRDAAASYFNSGDCGVCGLCGQRGGGCDGRRG